jgi:dihydroflavonol-4-reductase
MGGWADSREDRLFTNKSSHFSIYEYILVFMNDGNQNITVEVNPVSASAKSQPAGGQAVSGQIALVTGATGLLGSNLVRKLAEKGVTVRALARSKEKAEKQFGSLGLEIVVGDINDPQTFVDRLPGVDMVFHTAAYFRDNYKGGKHWDQLYTTNVVGTANFLQACYRAGIRRFVHISSTAILRGRPGEVADETTLRLESEADDYQRSKILSDQEVLKFLTAHPDFWAAFILPGWMHGPGDSGPTSAGQTVLDFLKRKMPGIPPGSFSVVDVRDVAEAAIRAAENGKRGERYLAAGRTVTMEALFSELEQVSGIQAPRSKVPMPVVYLLGAISELRARITRQPVLISWATVQLLVKEEGRQHFNHQKSERELGIRFREIRETLRDAVSWFKENGYA